MRRRDWYEQRIDKRAALNAAEESGLVADSKEFRAELVARIYAGEITWEQAQEELRKVKRDARKNGKKTRAQIWRSA
ncbi:hypothetical protein FA228_31610 [Pseudomonas aeruginosa]|nr:hypothetical protein [Pseudomonas aeruginosa]